MKWKKDTIIAGAIFVVFLSLYIYTAAPSIYDGDSGEIAAAVNTLGLAHPTGFPLYMLTGKLFILLLPVGDMAYRLNIFSALLTALALGFTYRTLRNLDSSWYASLIATSALGLGRYTIWSDATTTRVYALSFFLCAALLYLYTLWKRSPRMRYLYGYGLIWGLSLGTHSLMLVMLIPFVGMLFQERMRLKAHWGKLLVVTLLPMLQYGYLLFAYHRNGIVIWGSMRSFHDFWYYITQRQYAAKFFAYFTSGHTYDFISKVFGLVTGEMGFMFLAVAILGVVVLWRHDRRLAKTLMVMALGNLGMMYAYGKVDDLPILSRYLFITYLSLAVGIGVGIDAIVRRLKSFSQERWFAGVLVVGGGFLLLQLVLAYPGNNRHNHFLVVDMGRNMLATLPQNSVIFSAGDPMAGSLWYLQSIGERPDVTIVPVMLISFGWYQDNLSRRYPGVLKRETLAIGDPEIRLAKLIQEASVKHEVYGVGFNSTNQGELAGAFNFVPQGLLFKFMRKNDPRIHGLVVANTSIWDKYVMRGVKAGVYQEPMMDSLTQYYAFMLYNGAIATYYEKLLPESVMQLQRAAQINPIPVITDNLEYIKKKAGL